MNIQFMEKEVVVKDTWTGEDKVAYVPDFDELVKNASCEEEIEAIRDIEKRFEDWRAKGRSQFASFAFQIVYMAKGKTFNPKTCKWEEKWQMMQHPWYQEYKGPKAPKEEMVAEIERMMQNSGLYEA